MKARSRRGSFHSHTEGVTINFKNGLFETQKSQEMAILEKYDGIYWNIEKPVTEKVKVKPEMAKTIADVPEIKPRENFSGKSRSELYKIAKEAGYMGKYIESSILKLREYLEEK